MKRDRRPTTVGEMLKEEFLSPLGLTQRQLADHIGVEVKSINRLVNNKIAVSPMMALKLSAAFGTTPEFWMNLQNANDFWELEHADVELPEKISA